MPESRAYAAGAALRGRMYVVTGLSRVDGPPVRATEVYDPANNRWSYGPPIFIPRDRLGEVAVARDRLYVAGGWVGGFGMDPRIVQALRP